MTNKSKAAKLSTNDYTSKRKRSELYVLLTCIVGLIVCLYTIKVEIFKMRDSSYKALCDFNEWISCSKVFSSKYGKGFGLLSEDNILNQPNGFYGLGFYVLQTILLLFRTNLNVFKLRIFLSILSNLGSVYLGYILYFVLNDFCIVCVSLYFVNFILLLNNISHFKLVNKHQQSNLKKKSS